jgi:hypothetical protein
MALFRLDHLMVVFIHRRCLTQHLLLLLVTPVRCLLLYVTMVWCCRVHQNPWSLTCSYSSFVSLNLQQCLDSFQMAQTFYITMYAVHQVRIVLKQFEVFLMEHLHKDDSVVKQTSIDQVTFSFTSFPSLAVPNSTLSTT